MKLLIIRFSSFGDIAQTMGVVDDLAKEGVEIHWATRSEFASLVSLNINVKKVWSLNRQEGQRGLLKLGLLLRKERYSVVYDAHSNIRSLVLCGMLGFFGAKSYAVPSSDGEGSYCSISERTRFPVRIGGYSVIEIHCLQCFHWVKGLALNNGILREKYLIRLVVTKLSCARERLGR